MQVIEKTVFQFDELSEAAKQKALEWYRQASQGDNYYQESVYEDAAAIGDILGIDLNQKRVPLMNGSHRYDPCIYYSGFWSQGDGACFEGQYSYKKGALKAIRAYAPKDAELHRIAKGLQDVQKRHFYSLVASCKHRGRYYHSGCMNVDVSDNRGSYRDIGDAEAAITQLMRDFADWIYKQLENAYEWENADEQVVENIRANEYEFDENGNRA